MKHEITAKRLRHALALNNMKAQDLVELSGVKKASISHYVNGSHAPSNINAGKMAKVLNVNPLWLMGFDVIMQPETTLVDQDAAFIEKYKKLDKEDKARVNERVDILLEHDKYKKESYTDTAIS